jgi:hypothetical protein
VKHWNEHSMSDQRRLLGTPMFLEIQEHPESL